MRSNIALTNSVTSIYNNEEIINEPQTITNCFEKIKQLKLKYPNNPTCAYLNINSIANKFDNLTCMLGQNIDILCIAETKIDASYPTSQFHIPGYKTPYRLDVSYNSGGILVYVKENLPSRILKEFSLPQDIQAITIEINFRKSKWLLLLLYHPDWTPKSHAVNNICSLLDFYSNKYANMLVLGDFNMTVNDVMMSPLTDGHKLYSMINEPTCFKSREGKCIDLLLTNRKHCFQHTQTFETGISDHHVMIYTIFKTTFVKIPPKIVKYRCYKNFSMEIFLRDIFQFLCSVTTTTFDEIEGIFSKILNKHAPIKKKVLRGNHKPFVNKSLRNAIYTKSRLRKIANNTGNDNDIAKYKKQRNLVKHLNHKIKKLYYKNLDPKRVDMNKCFWKTFKPFFSNNYTPGEKMIIVEKDTVLSDDLQIAECMNEYFVNITKTMELTQWPEQCHSLQTDDIVLKAIHKYSNHPSIQIIKSKIGNIEKRFKFHHIIPEEVFKKVRQLDESKSTSGDIPVKIIKDTINICCNKITDCLNSSIYECSFPKSMKLGDVTPVFKSNEKACKTNYRPICILTPLSKVFERILSEQISPFMDDKLSTKLCGFRKGYNTQHALLNLLENWRNHLDKKEIIGVILCDLSKAFDTLPHDLLIAKLEAYGFDLNSLYFIYDYLINRKQRCKVGSAYSTWLDVQDGVPQGSVLGPLLFNVFINDFLYFIQECDVCNFADDNSLYTSGENIEEVAYKLEEDMLIAMKWFQNNSMGANPKKFQLMFLGTKNIVKKCLNINGFKCVSKTSILLLGINIDWKLNFNNHVNIMCSKATSKLKALFRLRCKLTFIQKMTLYNSFIMSAFNYCPVVWMFCGKTANAKIDNIQRKALQSLYNDFDSSYDVLLRRGNHLTIHELNKRHILEEVYKSIHRINPPFLHELFEHKIINHNLRIKNLLILPKSSTITWGIHSFTYRGSRSWNILPDDIKEIMTYFKFKNTLKDIKLACTCKLCID